MAGYDGNCRNVHGHTWHIEVWIAYDFSDPLSLDEVGIGIDFKKLKHIVDSNLPDHRFLNKITDTPTAEMLALLIAKDIARALVNAELHRLVLWESEGSGVEIDAHTIKEVKNERAIEDCF